METQAFGIDQTWLECISCGCRANLLSERKFRCPECGNLFDVCHDLSGFDASGLRVTFPARVFLSSNPLWQHSGVWRFKELIMPFLPEQYIVTLGEGNVPIVRAGKNLLEWVGPDIDLWLMLEGMTPTGSFKDFGGTVMMSVAKAAGIKAVICASTGDTSAMAAAYAAAAGNIKCAVVLPEGYVTAVQLVQPLVHGAKVITLPSDFDACMRVVQTLVEKHGAFPANSLNPTRIEGHQATVFLLAQFFGWELPNWVVGAVGNGSNVSSIGKGIRTLQQVGLVDRGSSILGAQSFAANPLARSWEVAPFVEGDDQVKQWEKVYRPMQVGETVATAARIGDPVSRAKVMREIVASNGAVLTVPESYLREAVTVCGRDGHFVCPQTGTALAAVRDARLRGLIKPGERVVVVSTATGLKFTESAAETLEDEVISAGTCEAEEVADLLEI